MAAKTLKVVRPGTYGTRMLQAGDPLPCSGPDARLYKALGWATEGEQSVKAPNAKPKAAPRKRARKPRKKTA